MKRWVATITIALLITGAVIWEQIYVNRTFNMLESQLNALVAMVEACPDDGVDTAENLAAIDELETMWLKREHVLCFLVKHTETLQISDAIIYAKNFMTFGNKEEVMSALNKLDYLVKVHHYNLGASFENII